MGTVTNHKFKKRVAKLLTELADAETFKSAQVELGTLLGFSAGNDKSDAAPDPWWLGDKIGIVFRGSRGRQANRPVFGAVKARQASSHPKWLKKNVPGGITEAHPVEGVVTLR